MAATQTQPTTQHDATTTREGSSSAPTWEYGAPDLGLGTVSRPASPAEEAK